ncbi:MAG: PEGA domain-containing protein [Ignavibacteriales bacterium]|nr:PEGA domain-containing protein [Ignavibacteriales bacterium]
MHKFLPLFFIVAASAAILWTGCKTTPPVEPPDSEKYQTTIITSDLDSSMIYLDDTSTGLYAPVTLMLTPGVHSITLKRTGFADITKPVIAIKGTIAEIAYVFPTRTVLLEDFANVSCIPCVASNILVEKLKHRPYNDAKLVVIKFATNFPSPMDPFYQAIPQICAARKDYYSFSSAPTFRVDGMINVVPIDSFTVKAAVQKQLAKPYQFIISPGYLHNTSGSTFVINAAIKCINPAGLDFSNLVVHTVLIENVVEYKTPPGNNGETKFYNVVRAQLPDPNGQPLGDMAPNQYKTFSVSSPVVNGWQVGQIRGVVFIQNKLTKEVYNAAYTFSPSVEEAN